MVVGTGSRLLVDLFSGPWTGSGVSFDPCLSPMSDGTEQSLVGSERPYASKSHHLRRTSDDPYTDVRGFTRVVRPGTSG